jgi:LmbE family N-acetylglucosaminyl deacetylase
MGSRSVVLSPHPDDAVLSCWHLLEGDDVTVVTVFGGVPANGATGWWDLLTGASDSRARARERLQEDSRALALAGATSVTLDLLDSQYRTEGPEPAVADAIAEHLQGADDVYAPLGILMTGDHAVVREAAFALRDDTRLYADHPHVGIWGLPAWVTGTSVEPLNVDAAWRRRMTEVGLDPDALRPAVHHLEDDGFERKLAALHSYGTQVAALEREAPFDQLRWEVTWTR